MGGNVKDDEEEDEGSNEEDAMLSFYSGTYQCYHIHRAWSKDWSKDWVTGTVRTTSGLPGVAAWLDYYVDKIVGLNWVM